MYICNIHLHIYIIIYVDGFQENEEETIMAKNTEVPHDRGLFPIGCCFHLNILLSMCCLSHIFQPEINYKSVLLLLPIIYTFHVLNFL